MTYKKQNTVGIVQNNEKGFIIVISVSNFNLSQMNTQINENYIYKLKTIVLGDKGVGKSTIVWTYLHEGLPKILPPNQDVNIYIKRQGYSKKSEQKTERMLNDEIVEVDQPLYQCHFHLWDVSGSICSRQTLIKLKHSKFYNNAAAIVYIFKDEQSFKFVREKILPNIPQPQASGSRDQYLIYNCINDVFSRKLQDEVKAFSSKQMRYQRLHPLDVTNVKDIFRSILKNCIMKIQNGKMCESILKDRNNKIVLRDNANQRRGIRRKYNRCC